MLLYDELARHDPSPVVLLNQAVARAQLGHPEHALTQLDGLAGALASYHLFHAARAELLTTLGRHDDAREANRTALGLPPTTPNAVCSPPACTATRSATDPDAVPSPTRGRLPHPRTGRLTAAARRVATWVARRGVPSVGA